MFDKLIIAAKEALEKGAFNEIELTDGNLKVRLVRFTTVPTAPIIPYHYVPQWNWAEPQWNRAGTQWNRAGTQWTWTGVLV